VLSFQDDQIVAVCRLSEGDLAKLFTRALALPDGQTAFIDFSFYGPTGRPEAFMAAPAKIGGKVAGVLVFQLSPDPLGERVRATTTGLGAWTPDSPLSVVIYTPAAFTGLSAAERARVIQVLQSATADGGVHLVQTIAAGKRTPVSLAELQRRYRGWEVTVEAGEANTFMARKAIA